MRNMNRLILFFAAILIVLKIGAKTIYILPFPGQEDDKLFDVASNSNRDNVLNTFYLFRQSLNRLGYDLKTVRSLNNLTDVQAIICFDVPKENERKGVYTDLLQYPIEKRVLVIFEPPSVSPHNYNRHYHNYFGRIYTMLDDFIDNKKYFKFYEMQPTLKMVDYLVPFSSKRLCVMLVGGGHGSSHPHQLYTERINVIDYFNQHAPQDLDFYGNGWEGSRQGSYGSYKGFAKSKIDCLKNYRFCICYENMHSLRGYITGEKILFCFVAGCVPVYWGASNVTDYIPKDCFVDRRDFSSTHELYHYLSTMSEEEYNAYIERIKEYLVSPQAILFSAEYFVDIFIHATVGIYDWNIAFDDEQKLVLEKLYNSAWRPVA